MSTEASEPSDRWKALIRPFMRSPHDSGVSSTHCFKYPYPPYLTQQYLFSSLLKASFICDEEAIFDSTFTVPIMEVALSAAGLALTGAQIGSALHEFISGTSNAPTIAQAIEDEIEDFAQILSRVQSITFGPDLDLSKASLIDLNHLSSTLAASVRTFSELEREIDRVKGSGKMDLWNRFRWARAEKNLLFFIQRLQSQKSTFSVILTILTRYASAYTSCPYLSS